MDKNFKVVKTGQVKPNRVFFGNPKYFWVLELPYDTIKKYQINHGDNLKIPERS